MSDRTDTDSFIHGSGAISVEPNSAYISALDGPSIEWDWQMLADQEQYQQQPYLLEFLHQPQQQTQPQHFQCGTAGQIPDRSKASNFGLPTPASQIGLPWTQTMSQPDPGQYEAQASHHTPYAATVGSEGQQTTSLPDLNWSVPSETQSTPSKRADDSVVNRTTPKLDCDSGGRRSRCQNVSHRHKARRSSQRYPGSLDEGCGKPARRTKGKSWIKGEKRLRETVELVDELTKSHRTGFVMQTYGYPKRSREEYESLS